MRFIVDVSLDSDDLSCRSPHRIARLLAEVASKLRQHEGALSLGDSGKIRDVNGNTVGSWRISEEED